MTARQQVGSPSSCTTVCSGWPCILANHSKESFPCSARCVPAFYSPSHPSFGQPARGVFSGSREKKRRAACVWREVVLAGRGCFLTCQGLCAWKLFLKATLCLATKVLPSHWHPPQRTDTEVLCAWAAGAQGGRLIRAVCVTYKSHCQVCSRTQFIPTSQGIPGHRFTITVG